MAALISVSDKNGVGEFVASLTGIESVVSTGNTFKVLEAHQDVQLRTEVFFLVFAHFERNHSRIKVHFAATFSDNFYMVFVSAFQNDDCN